MRIEIFFEIISELPIINEGATIRTENLYCY